MKKETEKVTMEKGKFYNIIGVKPEEIQITVNAPSVDDVVELAREIQAIVKHSTDTIYTKSMLLRALNTRLSVNLDFPKADIKEVINEKKVRSDTVSL